MDSNIESMYHMFDHRVEAIEFLVNEPSEVTDVPLMKLKLKRNLLICCIYRKSKVLIPSGQDTIQIGDRVIIVTTHTGFNDILDIMG